MNDFHKIIKIIAILLAIFIICLIINGIFMFLNLFINQDNDNNIVKVYENVNKLEIDLKNSNLKILKGEKFKIEASNVSDSFKVKQDNTTLKIDESSFWFFNNNGGDVVIYIPKNIDELSIDTDFGKVNIDNIITNELELDNGIGVVEITNSSFNNTIIDGGTGNINITNTYLNNLELNVGIGKVDINGYIYGNSKIDSGIGSVNLDLLGSETLYKLIIDSGIGNVKINDKDYNETIYGNGTNKIDIDGGIGSINIYFN